MKYGPVLGLTMVMASACSQSTPTAPTLPVTPTSVNSPQPLQSVRISGRVLDGANKPVAGASITQWDQQNTTVSGPNGEFELALMVKPDDRIVWMTVAKAGYETAELARELSADGVILRIHQPLTMAAGESINLAINPDDTACGYHWGYLCRTVRVHVPSSGTLNLEVTSTNPALIAIASWSVGKSEAFPTRTSLRVSEREVVAVEVQVGIAPVQFTLHTSLTPQQ